MHSVTAAQSELNEARIAQTPEQPNKVEGNHVTSNLYIDSQGKLTVICFRSEKCEGVDGRQRSEDPGRLVDPRSPSHDQGYRTTAGE